MSVWLSQSGSALPQHGEHLEPHIERLLACPLEQIPKLLLNQLHLRGERRLFVMAGGGDVVGHRPGALPPECSQARTSCRREPCSGRAAADGRAFGSPRSARKPALNYLRLKICVDARSNVGRIYIKTPINSACNYCIERFVLANQYSIRICRNCAWITRQPPFQGLAA
jgi:hypothetical protein